MAGRASRPTNWSSNDNNGKGRPVAEGAGLRRDKTNDASVTGLTRGRSRAGSRSPETSSGESQVGPLLYYEICGRAFENFEGPTVQQLAGDDGWKILLMILEHFDERPIVKMGMAMDHCNGPVCAED